MDVKDGLNRIVEGAKDVLHGVDGDRPAGSPSAATPDQTRVPGPIDADGKLSTPETSGDVE